MTSLRRPASARTLSLPGRAAEVAAETDVLVVGGGPAGIGAALGAAAAGARVVLAERYGFLGGWATAALVMPLASYYAADVAAAQPGNASLYPSDAGEGEPVIAGALEHFVTRLVAEGGAIPPSAETGYVVPFDAETFKWVADSMLAEAGVELLLHALATDVLLEGDTLRGVVFATKSGPLAIRASVVVDCTGDGDIAAAAGAPFEIGRAEDGLVQPMTLMFKMGGFEHARFAEYVREHPGQWLGVFGLWDLAMHAFESHEYDAPREDVLLFATTRPNEVTCNCTRVPEVVGIDPYDLSHAEIEGRRQVREVAGFLMRHVPGFENAFLQQSGTQVGVRETRRVVGEYQLTEDDVLGAAKFDDVIARNAYPVDIHNPQGRGTHLRRLPPHEAYDIPLRSLVPQGRDGLLVAGRCISSTHVALSSVRVMPPCMATGQGAGVCAALAAGRGLPPREVPHRDVQAELSRQGADVRDVLQD